MTNSAHSLGLPATLKEKMEMKVPIQAYGAEFPAQVLVLCHITCTMVSVNPYGQGGFVAPLC